jgi:hypothetical protein
MQIYNGKYLLQLMPNGHKYLVNGIEKPGVTSILGILNKPGLPQWAANQTVDYILNHSEPLLEGTDTGMVAVTFRDLKAARKASTKARDASANVGKDVHSWIEEYIKAKLNNKAGDKQPIKEEMKPSIESFKKWEKKYKPKYIFSERPIYSESGDYCGTCDVGLELKLNKKVYRVILDFKTGKPESQYDVLRRRYTGLKRPYTTVYIQDAFYDIAIEEEDGIPADKYGALYLTTDGSLLFALTDDVNIYRDAAKAILQTHKTLHFANNFNKWVQPMIGQK